MGRIEKALADALEKNRARDGAPTPEAKKPVAARAPVALRREALTNVRSVGLNNEVLSENRVVAGLPQNPSGSAYKMLRTRALQRMRANEWTTIAVTAAGKAEGKTVTAINLAISIAKQVDHSVFLLDLDLRRPRMNRYMGFTPRFGLGDYLSEKVSIEDVLVRTGIGELFVLANEQTFENSSEVLASGRMARLIEELCSCDSEQIIICDTPPLLATDDTLAFAPMIDAVLLVVAEGGTRRDELTRARDLLLLHEVNILGTVLNKSEDKGTSYYY